MVTVSVYSQNWFMEREISFSIRHGFYKAQSGCLALYRKEKKVPQEQERKESWENQLFMENGQLKNDFQENFFMRKPFHGYILLSDYILLWASYYSNNKEGRKKEANELQSWASTNHKLWENIFYITDQLNLVILTAWSTYIYVD